MPQTSETKLPNLCSSFRSARWPFRRQALNSFYGLLDYAAYPLGMLAVAPIVLRSLGAAEYGIWAITMAAVSVGSIIASGFGDANIQQVATGRGRKCRDDVIRTVRSTLGIHLALGLAISIGLWLLAPYFSDRLALTDPSLTTICLHCFRIAASLILIRSVETVCISTQRGFERYGTAVCMSVVGRLLGLATGAVLAFNSYGVSSIMAATSALAALALAGQFIQLKSLLRTRALTPAFDPAATWTLLHFGIFTWILSATGVVFSQCDRLIGGVSVGASSVVAYALCAQIAQPVYGLTAAGFHFLFPHIAFRHVTHQPSTLRKTVLRAVLSNWLVVSIGTGLLLVLSHPLLRLLAPDALASLCAPLLPSVLASVAILSLTVSGNYALVALGHVRPVALINVAAAITMSVAALWLLPERGIWAIISARLAFASIALLVYVPLIRSLKVSTFPPDCQEDGEQPATWVERVTLLGGLRGSGPDTVHQATDESALEPAHGARKCADVLGVQIDAVTMDSALAQIEFGLKSQIKGYICMAGVHGVMEAQRNPAVFEAYTESWMTLPDGMPTVWVGRLQGHKSMERVTGPDLMSEIFRRKQFSQFSHFFYGGKPGVAQELAESLSRHFPWTRVVGTYTPPFRDLIAAEERDLFSMLHRLKPSIIWVGISTPRQELFMKQYLPLLDTSLVFGVGAAFDYHTGRIKDCAEWIKRAGLQWLHRLIQDPHHLLSRYLRNNPSFIWRIGLQLAGLQANRKALLGSLPAHDRAIGRQAPPDLCTPIEFGNTDV